MIYKWDKSATLETIEQEIILDCLKKLGWSRSQAALYLGVSVRTIQNKLNRYKKLGIYVPYSKDCPKKRR